MVRRKKPQITGEDPKYAHTFERFRPVESDMPPAVKIPGIDDTAEEKPAPDTATPAKPQPETASAPEARAASAKPKPSPKPRVPKREAKQSIPKQPKPKPETVTEEPRTYRQVTLDAAVKVEQAEAMRPLVDKGLQQRDIIMLAGRRTTENFVLSPDFVPKPEGERLPMQDGYHTSKRLDAAILDAMRDEHDPLRVRSDPAMVRGQFETQFWNTLDTVIEELRLKYK